MNDLLASPTLDQQALIDCVGAAYRQHDRWPLWQYVEHELGAAGLDPEDVLRSMPEVGDGQPFGVRYGWVAYDRMSLHDATRIELTLAGCMHSAALCDAVDAFPAVLGVLADRYRTAHFSPVELTKVALSGADLREALVALQVNEHLLIFACRMVASEPSVRDPAAGPSKTATGTRRSTGTFSGSRASRRFPSTSRG